MCKTECLCKEGQMFYNNKCTMFFNKMTEGQMNYTAYK